MNEFLEALGAVIGAKWGRVRRWGNGGTEVNGLRHLGSKLLHAQITWLTVLCKGD